MTTQALQRENVARSLFSAFFYAFFFVTLSIFFVTSVLLFAVTFPFDRDGRVLHHYSHLWSRLYLGLSPGWRVSAEGQERMPANCAAVIVANHLSLFDILVLYELGRPFKWVAKSSLLAVPFLGWAMLLNQHVPLRRGDKQSIARMMERCERWLDRRMPVLLFPEGTRSPDSALGPFKDGAFTLAMKKRVPIVPVVISGTDEFLPKHQSLLSTSASASIRVLDPVDPTRFPDLATLKDHVRGLIEKELARG